MVETLNIIITSIAYICIYLGLAAVGIGTVYFFC